MRREPDALVVDFDRGLDLETLEQALAIERDCCPFFRFAFDAQLGRLRATVDDGAKVPALDVLADALG